MALPGNGIETNYFRALFEENAEVNLVEKITDFFPGIIYVYDSANEKMGYVNRQIKEILGYSYDDVKGWDGDLMKMIFNEDVDMVKKELAKYSELTNDESHSFNCRFNHFDGDSLYFKIKGTVLRRNSTGKAVSLLFVAQDVTQEMNSEKEAKASNALMKDSEDLLQFGTWRLQIETGKMTWSEGMYNLLGYNRTELKHTPDLQFFFKHVDITSLDDLRKAMEGAGSNGTDFERTFDVLTARGESKRMSTKTRVVLNDDGKAISLLGLTWDITPYYNLYHDLLLYKNMVLEKELFLKNGSWEYDAKTGITEWSEGMYHLFGYDAINDKGRLRIDNAFYYTHQSPEEIIKNMADWDKALKDQEQFVHETVITARDGRTKRLETYGKITRNKEGEVLKVLGTTRDITQLKEYEQKLETKIIELARSNKELEEFAYVASHDLQEPLRKITTFSERLNDKFASLLGTDGKVYLDRIVMASENMRMLIENLLEFSRTTRNEQFFEKTDLNKALSEALKELEMKLEETCTEIISDKLPLTEAIPSQMSQLFSNLLSNAIKFSKPGIPVEIRIHSDTVSGADKKKYGLIEWISYIRIVIEDNGIGFEKEYADKIFKIFQRLHGKSEYLGSGIGLAICKKIVDHHKGLIYAESELGKGSKFTFILPEKQYS